MHEANLSEEHFVEIYERHNRPVLLAGIADQWEARKRWTMSALLDDLSEIKFKCGEDDDGDKIRIKMKHFAAYVLVLSVSSWSATLATACAHSPVVL